MMHGHMKERKKERKKEKKKNKNFELQSPILRKLYSVQSTNFHVSNLKVSLYFKGC